MAFTWETVLQIVILILALRALHMVSAADSCAEVRRNFAEKNIGSLRIVPYYAAPSRGLRVCPNGVLSCCTKEMEDRFESAARREVTEILHMKTSSLKFNFRSFANKFQDDIIDTLSIAGNLTSGTLKRLLRRKISHDRAIAVLKELENLLQSLGLKSTRPHGDEAFERFIGKVFLLLADEDYNVAQPDESFEACVVRERINLYPNISATNLTTAIELARTFHEGLAAGAEAVNATDSTRLSAQCRAELVKMQYCSHCWGLTLITPCPRLCKNVLRGCLADVSQLDQYWNHYVTSLVAVTTRMRSTDSRYNLEIALEEFLNRLLSTVAEILEDKTSLQMVLKERCQRSRTLKRRSASVDPRAEDKRLDLDTILDDGRGRRGRTDRRRHRVGKKHGRSERHALRQIFDQALKGQEVEEDPFKSSELEKTLPIRRPPHEVLMQQPIERIWRDSRKSGHKTIVEAKTPRSQLHNRIKRFIASLNSTLNFYRHLPDTMCGSKKFGIEVSQERECWGGDNIEQQYEDKVVQNRSDNEFTNPEAKVMSVDRVIMNAIENLSRTTKVLLTAVGQKNIPEFLLRDPEYRVSDSDTGRLPKRKPLCKDEDDCEDDGSGANRRFYADSAINTEVPVGKESDVNQYVTDRKEHERNCKGRGKKCKRRPSGSRGTTRTTTGNSSTDTFNLITSCFLVLLSRLFFTSFALN